MIVLNYGCTKLRCEAINVAIPSYPRWAFALVEIGLFVIAGVFIW